MAHRNPAPSEIRRLLTEANTIAVVGASSRRDRPSHGMVRMLIDAGYRVYPVNPQETDVCGLGCWPSLDAVPVPIDLVDVFRRASLTPDVARDAVRVRAKTLWLQLGIWNDETAEIAKAGGMTVIMDLCIGVVHHQLGVPVKG